MKDCINLVVYKVFLTYFVCWEPECGFLILFFYLDADLLFILFNLNEKMNFVKINQKMKNDFNVSVVYNIFPH